MTKPNDFGLSLLAKAFADRPFLNYLRTREKYALSFDQALNIVLSSLLSFEDDSVMLVEYAKGDGKDPEHIEQLIRDDLTNIRAMLFRRLELAGIKPVPSRQVAKATSEDAPELSLLDYVRQQHAEILGQKPSGQKKAELGEILH